MRIHKTSRLIKFGLYAAIIGCAAGAATGTLAWYSYQKDVNLGLTGTTIKADKQIQVGLRTKTRVQAFEDLYAPLEQIEIESDARFKSDDGQDKQFTIYWIKGNYIGEILHSFQELVVNSAVNKIKAITSGKYSPLAGNAEWTGFKHQPLNVSGKTVHGGLIDKEDYSNFFYCPLVFRAIPEERDADYLPNEKIFLTSFVTKDVDAEEDATITVDKGLRCKVDYPSHPDNVDSFIFDPNADSAYNLPVGGKLNIADDIYYDYDYWTKKQIAYGEWETKTYFNTAVTADPTLSYSECDTFHANDLKGSIAIDMDHSTPSVCQTLGKTDIVVPEDEIDTGTPLAITDSFRNYGYVDLSIYLEGWDHNIINLTVGRTFSVDLGFHLE
jgi:hypothetical protein